MTDAARHPASAGGLVDDHREPIDLLATPGFNIGGMAVDPALRCLTYSDGSQETLEPKVMAGLVALHRMAGALHTRDDLIAACWNGTVVGDDAIQRVIQRLRKVSRRAGSFTIETIRRGGYRLVTAGTGGSGVSARGDAPSLAVLPFVNRSGEKADEALALGMGEDLIDALAEGVNVRVIAASATARYRFEPVPDLAELGQKLGVRYILEGHVRRAGDELRVTASLIEAASAAIVWSSRFARPLAEIAALQGDMIFEVAATLGATIFKLEMDRALRKPANLTAWECVARALAAHREYAPDALQRAIGEARHAVDLAPDYGLAQAMLALTESGAYCSFGLPDPARETFIRHHIDRAHVFDPEHAGVLAAIAASSAYIGRPAEGLPRAVKAIRLRPGHGFAHYAAGVCALLCGQEEAGLTHLADFLVVEPDSHLHYFTHCWMGMAHARREAFPAARDSFAESFSLFPGNFIARLMLAGVDALDGDALAATENLSLSIAQEPGVTPELHAARIDRFMAGSDLGRPMRKAVAAMWAERGARPGA